jgi:hypothetical protein
MSGQRADSAAPLSAMLAVVFFAAACAHTEYRLEPMTVQGTISVYGNEPFTAVILQTPSRNHYILNMSPEMRSRLITPTIRKITGYLYLDQWNGRDFAHLDVVRIEPPDPIE